MVATALKLQEFVQDNVAPERKESSEAKRRRIASQAQEACRDSLDIEAFMGQYGIKSSAFA